MTPKIKLTKNQKRKARNGKDWVAAFMAIPEAKEILEHFCLKTISIEDARGILRRRSRGTCTTRELLSIARLCRMHTTNEGDTDPTRMYVSLNDFLTRFHDFRNLVLRHRRDVSMAHFISSYNTVKYHTAEHPVDDMRTALIEIQETRATSFQDFVSKCQVVSTYWFAAFYFYIRGDRDILPSQGVARAIWCVVSNPVIFDFCTETLQFDIGKLLDITKEQAIALRADILNDMDRCRATVVMCPTFSVLTRAEELQKQGEFFFNRVQDYIDLTDEDRVNPETYVSLLVA